MEREDGYPVIVDSARLRGLISEVRLALGEFLGLPTLVVFCFLLLAALTTAADKAGDLWIEPLAGFMKAHVFRNPQSTSDLLSTIATSIITLTSITVSIILLAVQQAASSLTFQVIDQFLRRRINQFTFGFFVGLALYTLTVLSTVDPTFNPILGGAVTLLLAAVALYLLLVLLYTTIDQMRPSEIIDAIHDHTLAARDRQLSLVEKTRRHPKLGSENRTVVRANRNGFVAGVDVEQLAGAVTRLDGKVEVILKSSVGVYVAHDDPIAEIRSQGEGDLEPLCNAVRGSITITTKRDLGADPAYGIDQLQNIAWTSISTAKQNQRAGMLAIYSLRDILNHWTNSDGGPPGSDGKGQRNKKEEPAAIVYPDNAMTELLKAFEALAVASSESLQYQAFAEVVRSLAISYPRLDGHQRDVVDDIILRLLTAVGEHVPSVELMEALDDLIAVLDEYGRSATAEAVREARDVLKSNVGHIGSRSTRTQRPA